MQNTFSAACMSCLVLIFGCLAFVAPAHALEPVMVEGVEVNPAGGWSVEGGIDWEIGRTLTEIDDAGSPLDGEELDYDNVRVRDLSLNYGWTNWWQSGIAMGYSSNSADNDFGGPDEGGLEGFKLLNKFRWNENIGTSFSLGFAGDDQIAPYSADGFNIGVNVPFQMKWETSQLHANLGVTVQTGDANFGNLTIEDRETYVNSGIGYLYRLSPNWGLSGELVGHTNTIEDANGSSELILGVPFRVGSSSQVSPSLGVGLGDGSPDFALRVSSSIRFGGGERVSGESTRANQQTSRPRDSTDKSMDRSRSSSNKPKDSASDDRDDQPGDDQDDDLLEVPADTGKQEQNTIEPETQFDPDKAQQLAEEARSAFRDGRMEEAVEKFEGAIEHNPENGEYYLNLGSVHFRQGNYRQARDSYEQAIDRNPESAFGQLYLGATLMRLGEEDLARERFERTLEIDPDNEQARNYLQQLGE